MLAASASAIFCTGGLNGDSPTEITLDDINGVVQRLLSNDAYTILDNIEGEDRFGTSPIRNSYLALCSTQLSSSISNVATFTHVSAYPTQAKLRSDWGSVANLRFLISSIGSVTPNASLLNASVYNIYCTGMESYAVIEQDGYSASFLYRPPIYDGPLALNVSVGWKMAQVPKETGHSKLSLIDLEAYGDSYGDRAQA